MCIRDRSVGEVMSIGRTFRESIQKAFRSLEVDLDGLEPKVDNDSDPSIKRSRPLDLKSLRFPTSYRLLKIKEAFTKGESIERLYELTKIDPWFLNQIKIIASFTKNHSLMQLKSNGFSDAQIGKMMQKTMEEIRSIRIKKSIKPVFKLVDTCAGEFVARTPYCYSSYEEYNEIEPLEGKKVIVLGGGPNRIGQGIEFDYCCVQAVFGLKDNGYQVIMINCNPETVSTDFDLVDRLYFEPVTFEVSLI